MASKFKAFGKRTVDHPDNSAPVVTTGDWFKAQSPSSVGGSVVTYLLSLFPILGWISRYNFTWLTGDLIAGITVRVFKPQLNGHSDSDPIS